MLPAALARRVSHWRETLPGPASRSLGAAQVVAGSLAIARRDMAEERVIEEAARGAGPATPTPPGHNERIVEIPWVLSRVEPGLRVLDVGTANAPLVHRRLLRSLDSTELHVVDLAPMEIDGAIRHQADVRSLPFPDGAFDAVLCISTLEHIGMANDQYASEATADDPEGDALALRELGRVTRAGGTVLVTVPAGRAEQLEWLRQYSPRSWEELVEGSGLRPTETEYYALDPQGRWRPVLSEDLEGVAYDRVHQHARGVICAALTPVRPS